MTVVQPIVDTQPRDRMPDDAKQVRAKVKVLLSPAAELTTKSAQSTVDFICIKCPNLISLSDQRGAASGVWLSGG